MANRKMKIYALAITLFFTFGVWCTGFADPRLTTLTAQQSGFQPGCSEAASSSKSILTSSRTDAFGKDGQVHVREGLLPTLSDGIFVRDLKTIPTSQIIFPKKVPIYLSNSVLTI